MWRNLVVAGTISVMLLTGTTLAFASQSSPGTPGSPDRPSSDHWSEMAIEMGDQWPAMVDHMEQLRGDQFPDMVSQMQSMEPYGFDMRSCHVERGRDGVVRVRDGARFWTMNG